MDFSTEMWVNLVIIGILPLLGVIFWWWNDILYAFPLSFRCSSSSRDATQLPPGYMGFPFLGEMLSFLWYFKFSGSPDEFINSKLRKYVWCFLYFFKKLFSNSIPPGVLIIFQVWENRNL